MPHIGDAEPSTSWYLETMNPPGKQRELYLHLPPGYHIHLDPDVSSLRRPDGSQVALFSSRGFVAETVEQAAWRDRDESEGSSGGGAPSEPPPRSRLPWLPRPHKG